ncbi:MAG: hypothetical protein K0M69_11275 [Youngiibacter sp.]|nr:hypothetical protein [Youngiibacter sp.]
MKLVEKKQLDNLNRVEKYDLDDSYEGPHKYTLGLMICYLLATSQNISYLGLDAESVPESKISNNLLNLEPMKIDLLAMTMEQFMKFGLENQIRRWELDLSFQNSPIQIIGQNNGTVIEVQCPIGSSFNLIPLLVDVETATYGYHQYNPEIVEKMKAFFKLNHKSVIRALSKLERHIDIYNEFVRGMGSDEFEYPQSEEITEHGYSAKMLSMRYPLSHLGAYNYLIYLRESPEEALADLKKGLQRR